jgi:hypothetical protein
MGNTVLAQSGYIVKTQADAAVFDYTTSLAVMEVNRQDQNAVSARIAEDNTGRPESHRLIIN